MCRPLVSDSHVIQTQDPGLASSVFDMTLATWYEQLTRFEMLESLREIRDENWSVTFNEEDEDEAVLEENDIEDLIYEVCTS